MPDFSWTYGNYVDRELINRYRINIHQVGYILKKKTKRIYFSASFIIELKKKADHFSQFIKKNCLQDFLWKQVRLKNYRSILLHCEKTVCKKPQISVCKNPTVVHALNREKLKHADNFVHFKPKILNVFHVVFIQSTGHGKRGAVKFA